MLKVERKQFVMSLAVVVLAVVFVFVQYLPLHKKTCSLKAANAALIAENSTSGARLEALPGLYAEIDNVRLQIGDFDAKIPVGRAHGIFLQNLAAIMKKQGLSDLGVQPGVEAEYTGLLLIPISISCEGRLIEVFRFFKELENFQRIVQIEEVTMTGNDKYDGKVILTAKANIFYRADK